MNDLLLAQGLDKVVSPDGSLQAVIWIAVACIGALLSGMGIGARWLMGYLDRMVATTEKLSVVFSTETQACRDTFKSESEAVRLAHEREMSSLAAINLAQQNRAFETFEKHVERLSAAIEKSRV